MPSATPFLASSAVQRFLDLALPVSRAGSAEQFYDALKAGYLGVHARLTDDRSGEEAQALRDAFEATQSNLAQRLALQLCAMPLFEKPVLPLEDETPPEFLWLFTLPVVIRFSLQTAHQGAFIWPQDALPAGELLELLQEGKRLEPRARLGLFAPLYTRNDLLGWGPENMALHAVNAELTEAPAPAPLPVHLGSDRPAYRSVLFFGLGIARVPIGVKSLLQRREGTADLQEMEQRIAARLTALGIDFESVSVSPPCPVTSSCFVSNPAYLEQLAANCLSAREDLGAVSAQIKFPMPGYLEITARMASGHEVTILPPEPCCEPPPAVLSLLEGVVRRVGLDVSSAAMPQVFTSARLQ
jgi:hypothetical protein